MKLIVPEILVKLPLQMLYVIDMDHLSIMFLAKELFTYSKISLAEVLLACLDRSCIEARSIFLLHSRPCALSKLVENSARLFHRDHTIFVGVRIKNTP